MAPVINRIHLIDDTGQGEDGTIIDDALFQTLQDNIDALSPAIIAAVPPPVALSDHQSVTASGVLVLGAVMTHYVNNNAGADVTLTFPAPGMGSAIVGERIVILNAIGSVIRVAHGGNVINMATSAPTPIAQGGSATWIWWGAWVLVQHEQGAWIQAPFNATHYQGNSPLVVTVTAAQEKLRKYRLVGRTLHVVWEVQSFTLSGTANALMIFFLPGGFASANASQSNTFSFVDGNGAVPPSTTGIMQVAGAGAPTLYVSKDHSWAGVWALGASATVSATATLEVQ
jgi:hypothetical protein